MEYNICFLNKKSFVPYIKIKHNKASETIEKYTSINKALTIQYIWNSFSNNMEL